MLAWTSPLRRANVDRAERSSGGCRGGVVLSSVYRPYRSVLRPGRCPGIDAQLMGHTESAFYGELLRRAIRNNRSMVKRRR